jgi:hypothetical protein
MLGRNRVEMEKECEVAGALGVEVHFAVQEAMYLDELAELPVAGLLARHVG